VTLRWVLVTAGVLLALAVVIGIALLVGIVIGRGGQDEVAKKQPAEEATKEPAEEKNPETRSDADQKQNPPSKTIPPQSVVVGLGETGELSDRNVTVNDVQGGYRYPYDIPRPREGNQFVLMNVTITNTSDRPININPAYDFESEDSNGVRYMAQSSNQHPDAVPLGRIAPGGEMTGNIAVEAPVGESVLKLVYSPQG
jgi:hypothetical protein